jgi:hypothetical protein
LFVFVLCSSFSFSLCRKWSQEKALLDSEKKSAARLEQARHELLRAQKRGDFAKASELQYGVIPELEKLLKQREKREAEPGTSIVRLFFFLFVCLFVCLLLFLFLRLLFVVFTRKQFSDLIGHTFMLHDAVTGLDVAQVVSRATGIPVHV